MKNQKNIRRISFFIILLIYTTNKYLPYEMQLGGPLILGIMSFGLIIYMKIKGNLSKYAVAIFILMGIGCILLSSGQHLGITTGNDAYLILTLIAFFTILNMVLIVLMKAVIDKNKNNPIEEFVKVRNGLRSSIITCTIFVVVFIVVFIVV